MAAGKRIKVPAVAQGLAALSITVSLEGGRQVTASVVVDESWARGLLEASVPQLNHRLQQAIAEGPRTYASREVWAPTLRSLVR